jgi:hypothetical protein
VATTTSISPLQLAYVVVRIAVTVTHVMLWENRITQGMIFRKMSCLPFLSFFFLYLPFFLSLIFLSFSFLFLLLEPGTKRTIQIRNKLIIAFDIVYWTLNLILITRLSSYTITKYHYTHILLLNILSCYLN